MKIAFIVESFPKLSETFIVNQITGMIDRGHEIQIFALKNSREEVIHTDVKEYQLNNMVHYLPPLPETRIARILKGAGLLLALFFKKPVVTIKALKYFFKVRQQTLFRYLHFLRPFYHDQFDIVHCHFGPNALRALSLKKTGFKGKLVTTFHGFDVTTYINTYGQHVYDDLFNTGDLHTYNSEATKNILISLECPAGKMIKLPMGVNLEKFPYKARTVDPDQPINILSVGRLVEMKGREYAIKAVARVAHQYPRIKYWIAGDGELKDRLQQLIYKSEMHDKIKILGWVESDKLIELYNQSHIFLHPSVKDSRGNMEGQGVVLIEAQAAGLPVIATNHNAFPTSMIDGVTGFLVSERDVSGIADKLIYLIEHKDQWPEIGKQGREFAQQFDINILNDKLEQIYLSLFE